MTIRLLDPTLAPSTEGVSIAPRLDSLNGKTIGLWENGKANAVALLEDIGGILGARFSIAKIVRGTYTSARVMRPDEFGEARGCDLVLLATGD
jgi:hypothetical protein